MGKKLSEKKKQDIARMVQQTSLSQGAIAYQLGVSRKSVYKYKDYEFPDELKGFLLTNENKDTIINAGIAINDLIAMSQSFWYWLRWRSLYRKYKTGQWKEFLRF